MIKSFLTAAIGLGCLIPAAASAQSQFTWSPP